MIQTYTHFQKIKQLLTIFIPILVTQLALFSMNFFDTTMSGHAGAADLAGVAIGASLWVPIYTGFMGILIGITPIVSQAYGAKRTQDVGYSVIQAVYLSLLLACILFIIGSFSLKPVLDGMTLDTEVRYTAFNYLVALSFGLPALFVGNVLRGFIDALGKTRTTMIITLLTLPINILLNYGLIFGNFGLPRLGGVGAGYASAITYWFILFITIFIVSTQKPFVNFRVFSKLYTLSITKWKEILQVGVPIGMSIFFETSIFSAVTLLMSHFDTVTIAAHQTGLNFASFLYMIPLSVSMGLTIVVGFEVGAKRYQDAKTYSWLGVLLAVSFAFVTCGILLMFREQIAFLYSKDSEVIEMATTFLIYALGFQFFDAVMAPIQGALRGYKDVLATFLTTLFAFWVIGLPLGVFLAKTDLGAFGYWIGLIIGLGAGACGLAFRLIYLQKKLEHKYAN